MKYAKLVSLGCAKNLVDSQCFAGILLSAGYKLTEQTSRASLILINTCGFIEDAREEAINTILELADERLPQAKLVVTGCLVKRYRPELENSLPEVDKWIDLKDFAAMTGYLGINECGTSHQLTPGHYAYLRVSDGCSNLCAYCAIPGIRGVPCSDPREKLVVEARHLAAAGVRELIIIAQDTATYGRDLDGTDQLPQLLDELEQVEGLHWLRLLYLHPAHISPELIAAIKRNRKVVRCLDIPLQHIDDAILQKMNRHCREDEVRSLLDNLRRELPGVVIRTTLMTGFPGETERRFNRLREFVRDQKFGRLGVFAYSPEEGTPAAVMAGRPSRRTAENRRDELMAIQQQLSATWLAGLVGTELEVIIDGPGEQGYPWAARAWFDAPEVDGHVYLTGGKFKKGDMIKVKVVDAWEYDLVGEPLT